MHRSAAGDKALFNSTATEKLISFYPVVSTEEKPADTDYPFTAIVGTQRYQLGSGTRTALSERIQSFGLAGKIEISHQDAADLAIEQDDTVVVSSPHGTVTRQIALKPGLNSGCIFVPTGVDQNDAMNLFALADLTASGAAGWKTCAVKVEKEKSELK